MWLPFIYPAILLFFLLHLLRVVSSAGGNAIVCQHENDTRTSAPLPSFPKMFEAHIEVTDHRLNRTYEIVEYSNMEQTALYRLYDGNSSVCKYRRQGTQGHVIQGIRCNLTKDLPRHCFCTETDCVPFVPLFSLFPMMTQLGMSPSSLVDGGPVRRARGLPVDEWALECWGQQNPNVTVAIHVEMSRSDHPMPNGQEPVPVRLTIRGKGDLLADWDPHQTSIDLQYEITQFRPGPIRNKDVFLPPPGVFCPSARIVRPLPTMMNIFSVTMETILSEKQVISYTHHHYDSIEKLVAFSVRSHQHNPLSLGSSYDLPDAGDSFRVIHDFETGIQYMIDEKNLNCSVTAIPATAFDAALVDNTYIRLRHASELLNIEADRFVYVGERLMRGVPCDVWVAEKPTNSRGEYITLEVYFTQENWVVEVELLNQEKLAPMGITTYVALSPSAQNFSSVVHTYFFDYSFGHPSWSRFDISQCLNRINRLFLVLTLKVTYSKLLQYGLEVAEDSIRRVIAQLAGISPLRITNIFLSNSHKSDEVDVWFLMLDEPLVEGDVANPRPQISLTQAKRNLREITSRSETSVNLDMGPRPRKMSVAIKRGSLATTAETLHPSASRHHSTHYLKTGYTAGSMAGLGFSMALLGTIIGLFVGYLLWKRGTAVPYFVHG